MTSHQNSWKCIWFTNIDIASLFSINNCANFSFLKKKKSNRIFLRVNWHYQ
jgi:hypothetical protein